MKKNRKKLHIEKITEKIIDFFRSGSPLTFSETMRLYYGLPVHKKELSRKQLYNKVEKLRRQGWLEKKVVQDEIFYKLTSAGRVRQLAFKLRTDVGRRGDKATIIIFDIPEEKRTFRNYLRRLLKQMKFTMIQKSVFITPNVLPNEFYLFLKETDLLQYVKVIEGELRFH